jgi:hypothetical protein
MNKKLNLLIATVCFLLLSGCSLVNTQSLVPRKQIEDDIKSQTIKTKTRSWDFNDKDFKPVSCFAVNNDESKTTASNADLSVTVASMQQVNLNKMFYYTLYGKMLMHYKKDGDKWILEKAEPQDFTSEETTSAEDFAKFQQKVAPICAHKSN